jgi:single-strand DNA-binding protein
MLNKVQLIGFTGAAAEIRTLSDDKKVATLRVATNRHTKKGGERKDYTTWHQVEIWN